MSFFFFTCFFIIIIVMIKYFLVKLDGETIYVVHERTKDK